MLENFNETNLINIKYYSTIIMSLALMQALALEIKNTISKMGFHNAEKISKETKIAPTIFLTILSIATFLWISNENIAIYHKNTALHLIAISTISFIAYFSPFRFKKHKTSSFFKTTTFAIAFSAAHHSILIQIPHLTGMKEMQISNLTKNTYEIYVRNTNSENILYYEKINAENNHTHLLAIGENTEIIVTAHQKNEQATCHNIFRVPIDGTLELEINELKREVEDITQNNIPGFLSCKII